MHTPYVMREKQSGAQGNPTLCPPEPPDSTTAAGSVGENLGARDRTAWTSHLGGLDGVTGRSRHFGILMPASCRTKGNLTKQFGIHTLWFLTPCPWWWQSFISNCPELEAAKMHFCRGAGKLWSFWTEECHLAVKRNELSSHNKSQRCLKCIVLGDRSRSEKVASCVVPSLTF